MRFAAPYRIAQEQPGRSAADDDDALAGKPRLCTTCGMPAERAAYVRVDERICETCFRRLRAQLALERHARAQQAARAYVPWAIVSVAVVTLVELGPSRSMRAVIAVALVVAMTALFARAVRNTGR